MKSVLIFLFVITSVICFAQKSDLCQGDFWTEDEAKIKMEEFRQNLTELKSWEKHSNQIRKGMIRGMQLNEMPKSGNNFKPIIRNTRKMDGYIVENIAIASFQGFYVTGNLYRPIKAEDKCAAILCPHGHWENRRMSEEMQKRCAAFARMGAIVFAYDMIGFGESKQVTHDISIALLLQTYNSTRVLDYLLSRNDVDPERVGITGASGGGTQTFVLTAIDDRIKVSVPVVQVSAHFFGGCVCESGMPIHKTKNYQTNNVEIAAMCAPRPLLLISDGDDWTKNTPDVEFPYIKEVYKLYASEDKVKNAHFPFEVHDYGPNKREAAYRFMGKHLHLDIENIMINSRIDEGFISILPEKELQVFTEVNPIPSDALIGNESVLKYLNLKHYKHIKIEN